MRLIASLSASLITSDGLHHQVVAELEQREQRLYGLVESTVADEKETEIQIRSREARIEALEAALRARDRQLDALIAQSLERCGILVLKFPFDDCRENVVVDLSFSFADVIGRLDGSSTRSKGGAFICEFFDPILVKQL